MNIIFLNVKIFILAFSCALTFSSHMILAESVFVIPKEYQAVIDKNYRDTYTRITGFEFSGLHWNQWISIYANKGSEIYKNNYFAYLKMYVEDEEDENPVSSEFKPYQQGTVFLKEHFLHKDGLPKSALTSVMMIKREFGYDNNGGNWEYIQASQDGKVILAGNSRNKKVKHLCQNCHANMAERDYIFSTFYSTTQ